MKKIGIIFAVFAILCATASCSTKKLGVNLVKVDNVEVTIGETTIDDFKKEGFEVQVRKSSRRGVQYDLDSMIHPQDNYIDLYLTKGSYMINVMQFTESRTIRDMAITSFQWYARESDDTDFIQISDFRIYANDDFDEILKNFEALNPSQQSSTDFQSSFSFFDDKVFHVVGKDLQGEFSVYSIHQTYSADNASENS